MIKNLGGKITGALTCVVAIASVGVMSLGFGRIGSTPPATAAIGGQVDTSTVVGTNSLPTVDPSKGKRFRITASVASPEDLKVAVGDRVQSGQVIADRDSERRPLLEQQAQLNLSLQKINDLPGIVPPRARAIPELTSLPPANYEEEKAMILAAKAKLERAKRSYVLAGKQSMRSPESAQVTSAAENFDKDSRAVDVQISKLSELKGEGDLPSEVIQHEEFLLTEKQTTMNDSQANLDLRKATKQYELDARAEKLNNLDDNIVLTQAEVRVALAKLDAARNRRDYAEYQHSIALVQRDEQRSQGERDYNKQLQEYTTQKRDREFQLSQINQRLQDLNTKLTQLTMVRTPYAGTIKKIKKLGQNNNLFVVRITLDVDERSRPFVKSDSTPVGEPPVKLSPPIKARSSGQKAKSSGFTTDSSTTDD